MFNAGCIWYYALHSTRKAYIYIYQSRLIALRELGLHTLKSLQHLTFMIPRASGERTVTFLLNLAYIVPCTVRRLDILLEVPDDFDRFTMPWEEFAMTLVQQQTYLDHANFCFVHADGHRKHLQQEIEGDIRSDFSLGYCLGERRLAGQTHQPGKYTRNTPVDYPLTS